MNVPVYQISKLCFIGLIFDDCRDHLSKVNSWSCSRNQLDIIWALWHGVLSCQKHPSKMGTLWSEMDRHGHQQYPGPLWLLNYAQLVLKGSKCAKEISPTRLYHHQPELLIKGRLHPCFHVIYAKFRPYHVNVGTEIEIYQTTQCFANLVRWAQGNCSFSFLFLADRSGTQCGLLML